MDFLIAENVEKEFTNHKALSSVSINVPEQSIFGLLGPNGAGKTTLIRIINQITAPDSGRVLLNGEKLKPQHTKIIGYLPEERGLYRKMKVGEQAIYLAQLKGLSKKDAVQRIRDWFYKFDLMPWWHKKVEELSKGMQQKVQFITTILHNPKLLIFDEPFSGFDPINANLLKEEILNLRNQGATVLFSTHNMGSVEEICDHIALINKSKKILEGNVKEIKNQFKSNTFDIELATKEQSLKEKLGGNFQVLKESREEENFKATIKINGSSSNELLKELFQYGNILGFQEVIPSMNDIFISKVNEDANSIII